MKFSIQRKHIRAMLHLAAKKDIRYFSWSRRKARIDAEIESLRRTRADYIKQRLGLNVTDQKAAFKDRN